MRVTHCTCETTKNAKNVAVIEMPLASSKQHMNTYIHIYTHIHIYTYLCHFCRLRCAPSLPPCLGYMSYMFLWDVLNHISYTLANHLHLVDVVLLVLNYVSRCTEVAKLNKKQNYIVIIRSCTSSVNYSSLFSSLWSVSPYVAILVTMSVTFVSFTSR